MPKRSRSGSVCAAPHVERVRLAGLLHDVGKIGVPDNVLQKSGPLDDDRVGRDAQAPRAGRAHARRARTSTTSAAGCSPTTSGRTARGYPAGLSGDEISLEARILAAADAFEAMTGDRVYRAAMPAAEAIAELRRHAGTQFDPDVVEALIGSLPGVQDAGGGTRTPTALTTRT